MDWRKQVLRGCEITVALLLGYYVAVSCTEPPAPEFREITVHDTIKAEPDTVVKWKERIVYKTVTVTQTVLVPHGADSTASHFCEARTDTLLVNPPSLIRSGNFDGKRLFLYEVVANGDLRREEFRTHSPFSFAIRDSGALVQTPRLWWVKPAIRDAAFILGGYVAGRVTR